MRISVCPCLCVCVVLYLYVVTVTCWFIFTSMTLPRQAVSLTGGGLQFMLVFKCGGVREREKGETKTHRPETKIRGSFNGDYDALN